jgi:hypothetical protein
MDYPVIGKLRRGDQTWNVMVQAFSVNVFGGSAGYGGGAAVAGVLDWQPSVNIEAGEYEIRIGNLQPATVEVYAIRNQEYTTMALFGGWMPT